MDDLVAETGLSRHAIYSEVGGKRALFLAGFSVYAERVVTPALAEVDSGKGLQSIADYFERQISLAESMGLPGPGCFVANSEIEIAPDDRDVADLVSAHNTRLRTAFSAAIRSEDMTITPDDADALGYIAAIAAQGLWSHSRTVADADDLRGAARTLLDLLKQRIAP